MAEIHEVREVREVPVPVRRTSPGSLLLMFILGMIVAAALGFGAAWSAGVLHTSKHPFTVSWSAGRVIFGDVSSPRVSVNQ